MKIDVIEVSEEDRPVILALAQLYLYDFSEMSRGDPQHGVVSDDGLFHHHHDFSEYFAQAVHHDFLVRVDHQLAGFALVSPGESLRDEATTVWWMDEFFVLRKYRRFGVGAHFATTLFDAFPGEWQVAEMDINAAAQTFWRGVIGRYTKEQYDEVWIDDDRWLGPVQFFRSRTS